MAEGYKYRNLSLRLPLGKRGQLGVKELSASLTINGETQTPDCRYVASDIDGTDWPSDGYGPTLSEVGMGASPTGDLPSPAVGLTDKAVRFEDAKSYEAPSASDCQIGTEDFVHELVIKTPPDDSAVSSYFAGTRNANEGFMLYADAASARWKGGIEDAGGYINIWADDNGIQPDTCYHLIGFGDRSGNHKWYINAVGQAVTDISGHTGSLTSSEKFNLGALGDHNNPCDRGEIMYYAQWTFSDIGSEVQDDIAKERFMRYCGTWPAKANGTKIPTTYTRSCEKFLEFFDGSNRAYHLVGDEWLAICSRPEVTTGDTVRGLSVEGDIENKITESSDFSAWTLLDGDDTVNDDAVICPWHQKTHGAELIADTTDGAHGVTIDATLTADTYCFSVFVRAGAVDWIYLQDEDVANADCYFDVANGTIGTEGAGISESFIAGPYDGGDGNTWYRVAIRFTGTAAAHTLRIQAADSDGDNTVQGDDSTQTLYLWGAQCERNDVPTSPIRTDGATATRLSDDWVMKGDDGNLGGVGSEKRGSIELDYLPDVIDDPEKSKYLYTLSDGGDVDESIGGILDFLGDGRGRLYSRVAGATEISAIESTGSFFDGNMHVYRASWQTDDGRMLRADSRGDIGTDTGDVPDDLDEISIGSNRAQFAQADGLISDLKIWSRPHKPEGV